jgi:uncharacterized membrane protein
MTDKKDKNPTDVEARSVATVFMWLGYLVIIYMAMQSLGTWAALIAFVVMIPLIVMMGMMWGAFTSDNNDNKEELSSEEIEKRKRERIDTVLRDLSDDDLLRLRERLVDGSVNDEFLYEQIVGDDGELMYRGQ